MTTPTKKIIIQFITSPEPRSSPLEELRTRAAALRESIQHEPDVSKIANEFHDSFADEDAFYDLSKKTDDATFLGILGEGGILGKRYPGEAFEKLHFFCAELDLFHAAIRSPGRVGCAFQFAGASQGVLVVSPMIESESTPTDYLRYTIVPASRS